MPSIKFSHEASTAQLGSRELQKYFPFFETDILLHKIKPE
jgi:hypothetical protein